METNKTNEQKAAKYGYFNLANIPAEVINNDYFKSKFEDLKVRFEGTKLPEGLEEIGNVGVFFEVDYDTRPDGERNYYPEHCQILVFSDKTDVPMMLKLYKKQYYLHPVYKSYLKTWSKTNYQQRDGYISALKEPNKIGIFTAKKISDWIDYCISYLEAMNTCYNDIVSKANENRAYIEDMIGKFKSQGAEIYNSDTRVDIDTVLFSITFEMLDNGTYLSKKVVYKGTVEDVLKIGGYEL